MKKKKHTNFRVIVEPVIVGCPTAESILRTCDRIKKGIMRHVDDVAAAYVEFDVVTYCSHCGYEWEEDEQGCPLCCDKAQEEWEKRHRSKPCDRTR